MPRLLPLALLGTLLSADVGCYTYRPARAPLLEREELRVRFTAPESVDVTFPGRGVTRISSVTEVTGRALAARGDTLRLAVRSVWVGRRPVPNVARGATADIVTQPGTAVEVRRPSPDRTLMAVLATTLAVVVVYFVAAGISLAVNSGPGS